MTEKHRKLKWSVNNREFRCFVPGIVSHLMLSTHWLLRIDREWIKRIRVGKLERRVIRSENWIMRMVINGWEHRCLIKTMQRISMITLRICDVL